MNPKSAEAIRKEVSTLLLNFEVELKSNDLRKKVLALVPVFQSLRDLGKSLIPKETASSAMNRILHYFQKYPRTLLKGEELLIVSGAQDWPRRVRQLRVEFGWSIINGLTAKQILKEETMPIKDLEASLLKKENYILLDTEKDRDAAHRWNIANEIRRKNISCRDKLLEYFRENVAKAISGEELRYVSNNKSEWARRVRELRTEYGWPIATKNTGRPDMNVGFYILQADRQSPEHDRKIPDTIRGKVMCRDRYKCQECDWSHKDYNASDPRHLELHHIEFHHKGGENTSENLITLCTVCHDDVHRKAKHN